MSDKTNCFVLNSCRACTWFHESAETQLQFKTDVLVSEARAHNVDLQDVTVALCASEEPRHFYRHSAKLACGMRADEFFLGLYAPGSHTIVDIGNCPVQTPVINRIADEMRRLIRDRRWSVLRDTLRYVLIRQSSTHKQCVVTWVVRGSHVRDALKDFAQQMLAVAPEMTGCAWHLNQTTGNDIISRTGTIQTLWGEMCIRESYEEVNLEMSPQSFFQVHPPVARKMYARIRELLKEAAPNKTRVHLDVYSGIGSIGLVCAKDSSKVISIEESPFSHADALRNVELNSLNHVFCLNGRAESILTSVREEHGSADVITLNPSRRGCQPEVLAEISRRPCAKRLVYMSCDPRTLMRDASILIKKDWRLVRLEPYDMFPQTSHVETLAVFDAV